MEKRRHSPIWTFLALAILAMFIIFVVYPLALVLSGAWAASVGGGGSDGGAYSGGGGSSAASAGTKEQTKLAANQKGSGSGKKRRL